MSNLQKASGIENAVAVSARRIGESPFVVHAGGPDIVRGVDRSIPGRPPSGRARQSGEAR